MWLTEYGLIDFSRPTPRYPGEQEQTAFITSSTQMLDSLGFVERYAWFTLSTRTSPTGLHDGTTANASGRTYHDELTRELNSRHLRPLVLETAATDRSSAQTVSRSSASATARPRRSSSAARTACCCGEPRSSSVSPLQARTGPRTAKRMEAS
ncbi:glycosyl hydrolase [Streptomyces fagopyri]|uniref:glycosyl hydrolase n=1 Tax=Streptomyces fagopyri TaxID=2662397 RepID=UPI002AD282B9|nr:glycosyl hydrolase [Streptomyces fagopyri]